MNPADPEPAKHVEGTIDRVAFADSTEIEGGARGELNGRQIAVQ